MTSSAVRVSQRLRWLSFHRVGRVRLLNRQQVEREKNIEQGQRHAPAPSDESENCRWYLTDKSPDHLADRWVLTSSGVSPVKGPFTWSQIRASDLFIGHFDSQIRRMSSRCRAFQSTFATNCALHESHRLKCKENRHNFPFFCVQCRHSSSGHSIGAKCTQERPARRCTSPVHVHVAQ